MDLQANNNLPTFIVGFMGSGKTTWGKKLADRSNRNFVDLDHLIVEKIGMDIPQYFSQFGEIKFRQLESEILRSLSFTDPTIVSTGGGAPCFLDNMKWMNQHGNTIYFKLSPIQLWERLNKPKHINARPALQGLSEEALLTFIENKLNEREPFYSQAKHIVYQTKTKLEDLISLL